MEKLTIFTSTYNRVELLARCYESLKRQTCKDFMWLIIDDGSTDNTAIIVNEWIKKNEDFKIEYYYKENGGLHTGYNEAIKYASNEIELMMCVDSDDYLPLNSIENILSFWDSHRDEKYAGIIGLDIFDNGEIIGEKLPDIKSIKPIDLLTGKFKVITGDKKYVVRTDLYKKVAPMPVFKNEKNFNPHYMHVKICKEYDFLVLNEPLCIVEYQNDGMSRNIFHQYLNSPQSFAETRRLYMSFPDLPIKFNFMQCIHYVSSCIIAKKYVDIFKKTPKPFMTFFAYPFGVLLMLYIRKHEKSYK